MSAETARKPKKMVVNGKVYEKIRGLSWDKERNKWKVNVGGKFIGRYASHRSAVYRLKQAKQKNKNMKIKLIPICGNGECKITEENQPSLFDPLAVNEKPSTFPVEKVSAQEAKEIIAKKVLMQDGEDMLLKRAFVSNQPIVKPIYDPIVDFGKVEKSGIVFKMVAIFIIAIALFVFFTNLTVGAVR